LATKPLLYNFLFIPQAWTLSLELLFYLLIPFLHKKNTVIIGIILVSILIRFILYFIGLHTEPWTNRFFPTELTFFLIGTLVYAYRNSKFYTTLSSSYVLTIFISFLFFLTFYEKIPLIIVGIDIKQAIFFACIIYLLPYLFTISKKWLVDYFLGELSYPMYIAHILVFSIVQTVQIEQRKWFGIEAFFLTIIFSLLLFLFVDRPIDRYRQWRVRKKA
jgi:peptidoglycan/LPS O-acetylase OafA/YrhL